MRIIVRIVGDCVSCTGLCKKNKSRPTRMSIDSLDGPNGADSLSLSNKVIRERCIDLFKDIVTSVDYRDIMDTLIQERVLCTESSQELLSLGGSLTDCCRQLLLKLLSSKHPTVFIELRQALANIPKYEWIVDMIDSSRKNDVRDTGDKLNRPADWNRCLKTSFKTMQSTLADSVPISPVLDHLLSARVIGYKTRLKVMRNCDGCSSGSPQATICWGRLIRTLRKKRHQRAFIELRETLRDEHGWIVKKIDNEQDERYVVPNEDGLGMSTLRRMKMIIKDRTNKTVARLRRTGGSNASLSKLDISQPSDSRHVCAVWWDSQTGFKMDIRDSDGKEKVEAMLNAIGLSPLEINDEATAMFVKTLLHQIECLSPSIVENQHQLSQASTNLKQETFAKVSPSYQNNKDVDDTAESPSVGRVRRGSVIQTTILLVQGIALLKGVVYIACGKISYIMAYDAYVPDKKVCDIVIPGLVFAWDLVACPKAQCLFLTDFTNDCIWQISPFPVPDTSRQSSGSSSPTPSLSTSTSENVAIDHGMSSGGKSRRQLPCNPKVERFVNAFGEPWTLFVSEDGDLFQLWTNQTPLSHADCGSDKNAHIEVRSRQSVLLIYSSDGVMSQAKSLSDEVNHPHHVILSARDTLYVSHGMEDSLHRVCELSSDGKLVLRSYGHKAGSETGQLHLPWHMATNEVGGLFVVDRGNARVVLLDVELTGILLTILQNWVDRPWRLCYIPSYEDDCDQCSKSALGACALTTNGRLLVGTYSGLVNSYSIQT